MKCFHEACIPVVTPEGRLQAQGCFCGDGQDVLAAESSSTSSPLESIIEESLRRGLTEELEAMGLTLVWDYESQLWKTAGCDEQPWVGGSRELQRETRH